MRERFWGWLWTHCPFEHGGTVESFLWRRYLASHWVTKRTIDRPTNDTGIEDPHLKNLSR